MFKILTPIVASVFAVYLTIGITLGILPSFIQHNLAFGNLTVGITIGLQSLATLLTRAWSGRTTDTKGPHTSRRTGVILVLAAGLVYMLASASSPRPGLSLALILLSRLLHGASESLVVTGALTWGIGLLGHQHSGKVMTWNGIAMYAGIAAGAPLGIWMTSRFGVTTAFLSIPVLALISAASTLRLLTIPVDPTHPRPPFYKVIRQVAPQGLGLAFSSMGFACIATFISLLFTHFRWGDASAAFLSFGACYILTRVFFASCPDRFGGRNVALVSLLIEIAGQLLIAFSPSKPIAMAGCGFTGIGFSLIFPALGILAIKKVPAQTRGTALGAYAAFFDLSLGLAPPVAGLIAGALGYPAVYLFGALSALLAMLLLWLGKQ